MYYDNTATCLQQSTWISSSMFAQHWVQDSKNPTNTMNPQTSEGMMRDDLSVFNSE